MTTPADREFEILRKGHVRDKIILANFRNGLRALTNPETGVPFSEDEIQRATQPGGRFYNEADSIDIMGQLEQRRAIFMSDQARIERANTKFLDDYHGKSLGETRLEATGGSGVVNVPAVAGTIVKGSTVIPTTSVYYARDGAGKLYQVFATVVTPSSGVAECTMIAIHTGADTNLKTGDKLTWVNKDPNMEPTATVASDFSGGTNDETDQEYSSRLMGVIRHRPAAGNDAHFSSWARKASNAVEMGYVYPTALHANSVVVALTQKRAGVAGPLARIPNIATRSAVIGRIVPPNSPDVPGRAFVVVVPTQPKPTNAVVRVTLQRGSAAGWYDVTPFPSYHATTPIITSLVSSTDFTITCLGDATLPGAASGSTLYGTSAPQMMLWDIDTSKFVVLDVASVEDLTGNQYRVLLNAAPSTMTPALGHFVSPRVDRHVLVSAAAEAYFDALGPGNLFDVTTDVRGARCVRFPSTTERFPFRAGASLALDIIESLGGTSSDASLSSISYTEPGYPTAITDGPVMLTLASIGLYSL